MPQIKIYPELQMQTTKQEPFNIIIVEKTGNLKLLQLKIFDEDDLFKKCGFKKNDNFGKQVDWNVKFENKKYIVSVYAKDDGRANSENKYDFPPPIDNKLFFGSCAIVCKLAQKTSDSQQHISLSLELWEKIYEKLFGGFENLEVTNIEDENEEDELDNIPKSKKTKHGYLKDGFVVDSENDDEDDDSSWCSDDESNEEFTSSDEDNEQEDNTIIEDVGSELSEEEYDYSDADDKKNK